MDKQLITDIVECIQTLENESNDYDCSTVIEMLKRKNIRYRRYPNKGIQAAYESVLLNRPTKQIVKPNKKHVRSRVPLERISHCDIEEDLICECDFKNSVLQQTHNLFNNDQSGTLIISGPIGSGKTHLLKWLCKHYKLDVVVVDAILDLEDNFNDILKVLNQPNLVIAVEDVDDLINGHQSMKRPFRLLRRLIEKAKDKCIIIISCIDQSLIPTSLRLRLNRSVVVSNPELACRKAILRHFISDDSTSTLLLFVNFFSVIFDKHHQWISDVANLTNSYLPTHLSLLCTAAMDCCRKRNSTSLELVDFLEALKSEATLGSGNLLTGQCNNAISVPEVSWNDIGALDGVRGIMEEQILLQCRASNLVVNNRLNELVNLCEPCGILLVGPPGCGKTLIGKAVANDLSLNFLAVNGPELLNMYVGESERSVRKLFQEANSFKPCIIFFDEIDALCAKRTRDREGPFVLNQLLVEMDGLRARDGVYLMAATNALDLIDPAITRPGRFGTLVYIGLPDSKGRMDIIKKILSKNLATKLSDECFNRIVQCTQGYTGADLRNLINIASRHAILSRPESQHLVEDDIEHALKTTKPSLSKEQINEYQNIQSRCCNNF